MVSLPWNVANVGGRDRAEAGTFLNRGRGGGVREAEEERGGGGKVVDWEQFLFFLPLLNLKKKRDCSQSRKLEAL